MNRQECNRKILQKISNWIEKYPDERFIQALWNLKLIDRIETTREFAIQNPDKALEIRDRYYEEPWETLERMSS